MDRLNEARNHTRHWTDVRRQYQYGYRDLTRVTTCEGIADIQWLDDARIINTSPYSQLYANNGRLAFAHMRAQRSHPTLCQ